VKYQEPLEVLPTLTEHDQLVQTNKGTADMSIEEALEPSAKLAASLISHIGLESTTQSSLLEGKKLAICLGWIINVGFGSIFGNTLILASFTPRAAWIGPED
jgi:hypothetical protein